MDYLKEGIGLRAMAQRDPLVEYQREGFVMFNAMNEAVKEEAVGYVFHLEVKAPEPAAAPADEAIDETASDAQDADEVSDAAPAPVATATKREPARAAAAAPALDALGLEAPQRPSNLQYSAPSEDGSAFVSGSPRGAARRPAADQGEDGGEGSVNREERRRAAKQAKKR